MERKPISTRVSHKIRNWFETSEQRKKRKEAEKIENEERMANVSTEVFEHQEEKYVRKTLLPQLKMRKTFLVYARLVDGPKKIETIKYKLEHLKMPSLSKEEAYLSKYLCDRWDSVLELRNRLDGPLKNPEGEKSVEIEEDLNEWKKYVSGEWNKNANEEWYKAWNEAWNEAWTKYDAVKWNAYFDERNELAQREKYLFDTYKEDDPVRAIETKKLYHDIMEFNKKNYETYKDITTSLTVFLAVEVKELLADTEDGRTLFRLAKNGFQIGGHTKRRHHTKKRKHTKRRRHSNKRNRKTNRRK